jgi:hypothetical protein
MQKSKGRDRNDDNEKVSAIPIESIFNSRCNIRNEMTIRVSEEDYKELLDQYDIDDW